MNGPREATAVKVKMDRCRYGAQLICATAPMKMRHASKMAMNL